MQCQSRWGPPATPTNVVDWGTTQRGWWVKAKGRGWDHPSKRRWRSGESPSTGTSPGTTPGWEGAIPSWCHVGEGLLLPLMSMPKDPECSPLWQSAWIEWHTRHMEMLPWWRELIKIPGHKDYQEFAWKVHASFKMPKVCNWVKRVDNDHIPHWHTLWLESTISCHLLMWGLALRTTDFPNHTIPLPTWGHYSIGLRRSNHQSLANLTIWQKAWWNSSRQWSCWSCSWK